MLFCWPFAGEINQIFGDNTNERKINLLFCNHRGPRRESASGSLASCFRASASNLRRFHPDIESPWMGLPPPHPSTWRISSDQIQTWSIKSKYINTLSKTVQILNVHTMQIYFDWGWIEKSFVILKSKLVCNLTAGITSHHPQHICGGFRVTFMSNQILLSFSWLKKLINFHGWKNQLTFFIIIIQKSIE